MQTFLKITTATSVSEAFYLRIYFQKKINKKYLISRLGVITSQDKLSQTQTWDTVLTPYSINQARFASIFEFSVVFVDAFL